MMFIALQLAAAAALQPANAPCAAAGRSFDPDPAGLNVRAGPSTGDRVVGRLYSVLDPEAGRRGARYGPVFAIREVQSGWVRIADAAAESEGADGEVRRNYTGSGWVSANFVHPSIVTTNNGDPGSRGYSRPDFAARVADPQGYANIERARRDGRHPRLLACQGPWVELEYRQAGGRTARAWFRSGAPGE